MDNENYHQAASAEENVDASQNESMSVAENDLVEEPTRVKHKPLRSLKWFSVLMGLFVSGMGMAQNPENAEKATAEGAVIALFISFIIFLCKGRSGLKRSEKLQAFLFDGMTDLIKATVLTTVNIVSIVAIALISLGINQGNGWQFGAIIILTIIFYWTLQCQWVDLSRIEQSEEYWSQGYESDNPPTWLLYGRLYLVFKGLFHSVACAMSARSLMYALESAGSRATVRVKEALTLDWKAVRLYGRTATIKNVLFHSLVLYVVLFFCKRLWEDVLLRTKSSQTSFSWFNAYAYVGTNLLALALTIGCSLGTFGIMAGPKMIENQEKQKAEAEALAQEMSGLTDEKATRVVNKFVASFSSLNFHGLFDVFAREVYFVDQQTQADRFRLIELIKNSFSPLEDMSISELEYGIKEDYVQCVFKTRCRNKAGEPQLFYSKYTFEVSEDGWVTSFQTELSQSPLVISDGYRIVQPK